MRTRPSRVAKIWAGTKQDGFDVFQKVLYAEAAGKPVVYVMSAMVDGARASHTLTFLMSNEEDVAIAEANNLLSGFSIIDRDENLRALKMAKSASDYTSAVFGYQFQTNGNEWFAWDDLASEVDGGDIGALTANDHGSVVMPVCWQGDAPTQNAIYPSHECNSMAKTTHPILFRGRRASQKGVPAENCLLAPTSLRVRNFSTRFGSSQIRIAPYALEPGDRRSYRVLKENLTLCGMGLM